MTRPWRFPTFVLMCFGAGAAHSLPAPGASHLPPKQRQGASVAFIEHEAEAALTTGTIIGPDRRFTTLAAEASGRRAVRLDGIGPFVEFTLDRPANALVVRAAVPDNEDGKGLDGALVVRADTVRLASLPVTSRYGWFYGRYPFTNNPRDGNPHHYFDEARLLLARTLPAGTRVRLSLEGAVPWAVVDLVDFELVPPPRTRPPSSVALLEFGADPTGARSSSAAFRNAIAAATRSGRTLWVAPGTYRVDEHLIVDRVRIEGAGAWYSVVRGDGVGFYGREAPGGSRHVLLKDFSIVGEVKDRQDDKPLSGVGGAMSDSVIDGLWIQHVKVGLWFDGPMRGLKVRNVRISDVTADGLNFHRGVVASSVENSFIRGTGDDGLAAWSGKIADRHIVFSRNTIVAPVLANGIAIYGGSDITVSNNLVTDTLTEGGGIHVGNRFNAVPVSGSIDISDNRIVRSGSLDPNWKFGVGALWFYALDAPITGAIRARGNEIVDSTREAVLFIGKPISGITIEQLKLEGGDGHAITIRSAGSAHVTGITTENGAAARLLVCETGFDLSGELPRRDQAAEHEECGPSRDTTIGP